MGEPSHRTYRTNAALSPSSNMSRTTRQRRRQSSSLHLLPLLLVLLLGVLARSLPAVSAAGTDEHSALITPAPRRLPLISILFDDDDDDDDDDDSSTTTTTSKTSTKTSTSKTTTFSSRTIILATATTPKPIPPIPPITVIPTRTTNIPPTTTTTTSTERTEPPNTTTTTSTTPTSDPTQVPDDSIPIPVPDLELSIEDVKSRFRFHIKDFEPTRSLKLFWNIRDGEILDGVLMWNATKFALRSKELEDDSDEEVENILDGDEPGDVRYNERTGLGDTLSGTNIWGAWAGIGFGRSMLHANLLFLHANPESLKLEFTEAKSIKFKDPSQVKNPIVTTNNLTQIVNNTLVLGFSRPLVPKDTNDHWTIPFNEPVDIIWAFHPTSDPEVPNRLGEPAYHSHNRGRYVVNFSTGVGLPQDKDGIPMTFKHVHALGMVAAWMFLMPFAMFWARYMKTRRWWLWTHIILQTTVLVFTLTAFVVIVRHIMDSTPKRVPKNLQQHRQTHPQFGFALVAMLCVQHLLGVCNGLALRFEWINVYKKMIGRVHDWHGRILILLGFVQCGLGLEVLYPKELLYARGRGAWVVYIILVSFWVALFIGMEVRRVLLNRKSESSGPRIVTGWYAVGKSTLTRAQVGQDRGNSLQVRSTEIVQKQSKLEKVKVFTWKEVNQSVLDGTILVASGEHVYDITQWVKSHPGGQIIMYTVAGTDITNDFFALQKSVAPDGKSNSDKSIFRNRQNTMSRRTKGDANGLDETEYKYLVRSRVTRLHSTQAIEKLSTMVVGRINEANHTSCDEYRRYALVAATRVGNAMLFKFHTVWSGTATALPIVPGSQFEMSTRMNNVFVTKRVTPIHGTMECFECVLCGEDRITKWFMGMKAGVRQIKIRGPILAYKSPTNTTAPLTLSMISNAPSGLDLALPNPRGFNGGRAVSTSTNASATPKTVARLTPWWHSPRTSIAQSPDSPPRRILILTENFCAVSFALQTLSHILLPLHQPLVVRYAYASDKPEELDLKVGDVVKAEKHTFDGWAYGVLNPQPANGAMSGEGQGDAEQTATKGFFPLAVTSPVFSPPQITVVSSFSTPTDVEGVLSMPVVKGLEMVDGWQWHWFGVENQKAQEATRVEIPPSNGDGASPERTVMNPSPHVFGSEEMTLSDLDAIRQARGLTLYKDAMAADGEDQKVMIVGGETFVREWKSVVGVGSVGVVLE
ncbi:hypothetical protein BC832DRAFT_108576 [Gaertneriomyces semiglobifer]|nr:hypothetical protein BC832DRAFT_108576 [Gaertneriomyces semiglobifer]